MILRRLHDRYRSNRWAGLLSGHRPPRQVQLREIVEDYRPPIANLSIARNVLDLPEPARPLRSLVGFPEQVCGRLLVRYTRRLVAPRLSDAARDDPASKALLIRIGPLGSDDLLHGDEEIAMFGKILDEVCVGWPFQLQQWLDDHSLLRSYDRVTTLIQRSRRGWADADLWALDRHFTVLLAGGARQIADLSFGHSARLWSTHEEWVADLRQLADNLDQLTAHLDKHGALNGPAAEALCDKVFAMLRKSYGHLRLD